jgi:hypothetical protein
VPEEKIGLIGITTLDGPVRPNGNHLRWTFPPALGFPPNGFQIFRRDSKKPSGKSLSFSELPLDVPLPDDLQIDNIQFLTHPGGRVLRCRVSNQERRLSISPSSSAQLELRFDERLAHVRVTFSGSGYGAVTAFRNKRAVARVVTGDSVRELFCAGANRIIIDLGPGEIRAISFTTEASACNAGDWALLKKLPLPDKHDDVIKLLEPELKNYYASSRDAAKIRYDSTASEIVEWRGRLLAPTDSVFENPQSAPHLLKVKSGDEKPSTATYPQSLFFLAALDPNIARMMCLYWVDAYEPATPALLAPPNKNAFYDYKVEGDWKDGDGRCGLLLNLGPPAAQLPSMQGKLTGKQLDGVRWIESQMRGRLGLSWPKLALGDTPQARATQPVVYEITKHSSDPEQIIVSNESWQKAEPILYVDPDLPQGLYVYKVRPIDLFGQVGPGLESDELEIKDTLPPPPPIRTQTRLTQNGSAASLQVQFEFGATQHQQAPDIKEFRPYWRPDNLISRRTLNVTVVATAETAGGLVHTIRVRNGNLSSIPFPELNTFVGDVITNVVAGTSTLAASDRRRFRIANAVTPDRLILEAAVSPITNGNYELVRDPHNKSTWNYLPPNIPWREPIGGVLKWVQQTVPVTVLSVKRMPARPDPFALVPLEKRPRSFPNLPASKDVIEIEINRVITEPDVFAGGSANKTGTSFTFDLVYVITSLAEGVTSVALPADSSVAVGDNLELTPSQLLADTVRQLGITGTVDNQRLLTHGGEIAVETRLGGSPISSIMRVISNSENQSGTFNVVVRAEDANSIAVMRLNQSRIRYYAPFVFKVDVAPSASIATSIALPIVAQAGRRDGFIALSSIDPSFEGPIGTASQFTLIAPRPTGAPSRPYPCGMDVSAEAGYASPPNRACRATVCLTWDTGTLSPSDGVRYEVVRALDNGIVTAHQRNWQLGKSQPLVAPVSEGVSISGTLDHIHLADGLIRATLAVASPVSDPAIFRNGRLIRDGIYYQITLAKGSGAIIDLLLRGPGPLSPGVATLEAPPDYSAVKTDDAALQALALQVPDAFALATGVPVSANRFIDDVAGKGQNRFFYRVRAVDAAENRSDFSPISAPFYQLDTSAPNTPSGVIAVSGIRSVTLRWTLDPTVDLYDIHRASSVAQLSTVSNRVPLAQVNAVGSAETPVEVVFRDESVEVFGSDSSYWYCVVARRSLQNGPAEDDRIIVSSQPSEVVRATPVDPDPPRSPTDLTAVRALENGRPAVRLNWSSTTRLQFLVRRRLESSSSWVVVRDWSSNGAVSDSGSGLSYDYFDEAPTPERLVYQVVAKNHAGRTAISNETEPV